MNELIRDCDNGLLVASRVAGSAKSGIPAHEPDAGELSAAIEAMAEPALREKLSQNMAAAARGLAWQRTVEGFDALLKF